MFVEASSFISFSYTLSLHPHETVDIILIKTYVHTALNENIVFAIQIFGLSIDDKLTTEL